MIVTLEDFIEDQCGMLTPNLLELFEPHREFVETHLKNFNLTPTTSQLENLWAFLPNPISDDFKN